MATDGDGGAETAIVYLVASSCPTCPECNYRNNHFTFKILDDAKKFAEEHLRGCDRVWITELPLDPPASLLQ